MVDTKKKSLRVTPEQMDFFFLTNPEDKNYSHAIEFYDSLPKYFWGSKNLNMVGGKYLPVLERPFTFRGQRYTLLLTPARLVEMADGKMVSEREVYPGLREELVEDALRKMAVNGQGCFLADDDAIDDSDIADASVVFSLYALQKELASRGHTFNKDEIKEAIMVCSSAKIVIHSGDGSVVVSSSIFPSVVLATREDLMSQAGDSRCYVRFNPLVTRSIRTKTFRQYNYLLSMQLKSVLARWLYKRLCQNFTQASVFTSFNILLSTVVESSGCRRYSKITNQALQFIKSLDELISKKILRSYDKEEILSADRKNKIADYKFNLHPHPDFVTEMKRFNHYYLKEHPSLVKK